jgi:hypothetical protein
VGVKTDVQIALRPHHIQSELNNRARTAGNGEYWPPGEVRTGNDGPESTLRVTAVYILFWDNPIIG